MTAVSAKIKKPNWSEAEVLCLVDNVTAADIVDKKFSSTVTASSKHRFWDEVAKRINSICVCTRTQEEIKKKWADLKSSTKKKGQSIAKWRKETGGGPAPFTLKEYEEKILGYIPQATVVGIEGGYDSFPVTEEPISTDTNPGTCAVKQPEKCLQTPETSTAICEAGSNSINEVIEIEEIKKDVDMPEGYKRKITDKEFKALPAFEREYLNIEWEKLKMKKRKLDILQNSLEQKNIDVPFTYLYEN